MAMIYQKGKPMRYTGADAAYRGAKKAASMILSAPKKYMSAVAKANARQSAALKQKEKADIERAFGSVANYKKLDPLFRGR